MHISNEFKQIFNATKLQTS